MLHNQKRPVLLFIIYEWKHAARAALSLELRRQPNSSVTVVSQDDLQL